MFAVRGENRGRLLQEQGTGGDREGICRDWCLDCPEIGVGYLLLLFGAFEGQEGSSPFWLTPCFPYSTQVTPGCGQLRLEVPHPQTRSFSRQGPI